MIDSILYAKKIDNAGNVINRIDYDAFGNILSVVDPSDSDSPTELATRFLFTGQEWDSDVNHHYYNDPTGSIPATGGVILQTGDLPNPKRVG